MPFLLCDLTVRYTLVLLLCFWVKKDGREAAKWQWHDVYFIMLHQPCI